MERKFEKIVYVAVDGNGKFFAYDEKPYRSRQDEQWVSASGDISFIREIDIPDSCKDMTWADEPRVMKVKIKEHREYEDYGLEK